jgi:succinate dehydrogenase / fumarate reductase flavoprotein subunit
MYQRITGEDPYQVPMRIYPAVHYTMGGLWVDYNLMSNLSGLFILGEANFSDHGANRLGASALMQGLADGYFIIPCTIGQYLASTRLEKVSTDHPEFHAAVQAAGDRIQRLLTVNGRKPPQWFHRKLGHIMWEYCGMSRTEAGLRTALEKIPGLREQFWRDLLVTGENEDMNMALERAGRVADFLEFGELVCRDALQRNESCGGHFREEYQTSEGEARRNDRDFCHVAVWEYQGPDAPPLLHTEPLVFENVTLSERSYK